MNRTTPAALLVGIAIGAVGVAILIERKLRGGRYVVIDMERLRSEYEPNRDVA